MYEYKFVVVEIKENFWTGTQQPIKNYEEVIHQHAKEGWRFVQIFAPSTEIHGRASYFELIFNKRNVTLPYLFSIL